MSFTTAVEEPLSIDESNDSVIEELHSPLTHPMRNMQAALNC